mgnify:FL=1
MNPNATVRPVRIDERSHWQRLWELYLDFYESPDVATGSDSLWSRIVDPESPIRALVAELDGTIVGLVHFFPHESTWQDRPVCYLQDLYVEERLRGQGIGEKLIDAVVEAARADGWANVYWQTAADNVTARRLYDRLTGGFSGFLVYELDV